MSGLGKVFEELTGVDPTTILEFTSWEVIQSLIIIIGYIINSRRIMALQRGQENVGENWNRQRFPNQNRGAQAIEDAYPLQERH